VDLGTKITVKQKIIQKTNMTLIKSISGIRGTIGGKSGEGLSPLDAVKFTSAYATLIGKSSLKKKIVVGRDARISGEMVSNIVIGTLMGMGFDVVNIGLATTPTTELAVVMSGAAGGIILTASHNPKQWNALKLLNERGEFLNAAEGELILKIAADESFSFSEVDHLGKETTDNSFSKKHIDSVLALELVDVEAIREANFRVVIDCVNSVGGIVIPELLEALGVKQIEKLYCEPNGQFPHNPEPLPEHLTEIASVLKQGKADVGFVVDPDVDRLAIICEDGEMFGEEYTLVSIADYVLSKTPGNTVSNLSSTRALRDITRNRGQKYEAAAVGEVNVVEKMKSTNAVIGGEGNGGIIYPASHYGRDALVGIALFLTQLAKSGKKTSELRASFPTYFMAKQKIELTPNTNVDAILDNIANKFRDLDINTIDGVKIDWSDKWVHLRKSNTEPIIRIYSEAPTVKSANELAQQIIDIVKGMAK
jgi:phosphomannomutase